MVNSEPEFFEGVEKLLEVWFTKKDGIIKNCDLRKVSRQELETLLSEVKCEIISHTANEMLDAYVLSESSMFISQQRFILKTCGTTTPLACLPELLKLVRNNTGFDVVQDLYYSRKNFKRPELQQTPHRDFKEETKILDALFPHGRAYQLGSVNRSDCWYLYAVPKSSLTRGKTKDHDVTLEVIMVDLDHDKMDTFFKKKCPTAKEATKLSGIDKLIPGLVIDDYLFDPCGYSMNAVKPAVEGFARTNSSVPTTTEQGEYMTIHITPEPQYSYVSFETNIPQKSYKELIQRIIATFGPSRFIVTFFSNTETLDSSEQRKVPEFLGFDVMDLQLCHLPDYDLTYALYNRSPS